jgi:tetratricopeptide (TPR) repeat protein
MRILLILLVLVAVSCASNKDGSKPLPKEVSDISNSDFVPKKEKVYNRRADTVKVEDKEIISKNILVSESLDKGRLFEDFKVESKIDELARTCYEKEFKDAREQIRILEEEYRSNVIFWNQVATCFMLEKDYRKALLFYNKALEFNTNYAPVLNNIGVMYERQGEDERALISYEKASKNNKYARTPKYNMAMLYLKYGLYNKSKNILSGLKRINSKDSQVLNALAVSELMSGDVKSALSNYSLVDPELLEEPAYGVNYAYALFVDGKKEKAHDAFEDVDIEKNDSNYSYYLRVKSLIGVR